MKKIISSIFLVFILILTISCNISLGPDEPLITKIAVFNNECDFIKDVSFIVSIDSTLLTDLQVYESSFYISYEPLISSPCYVLNSCKWNSIITSGKYTLSNGKNHTETTVKKENYKPATVKASEEGNGNTIIVILAEVK